MINFLIFFVIFFGVKAYSDEIIRDVNGNYFLIKKDGSYKKLPPLKKGKKYVIKKIKKKKSNKTIFKQVEKKSRIRTNQGFR